MVIGNQTIGLDQHTLGHAGYYWDERVQFASTPSWYVTSHPGQLSLAIPQWVGAVSTSVSHDTLVQYLWPFSVSCCLAEGYWKQRLASLYGPMWLTNCQNLKLFVLFYASTDWPYCCVPSQPVPDWPYCCVPSQPVSDWPAILSVKLLSVVGVACSIASATKCHAHY